MKSTTALAALIGIAFAASSSSVFAQSGAPGSTPSKPNKVTSVPPPPPPPGGPDKLTTNTQPPKPGSGPRSVPYLGYWPSPGPKPIDDIADSRKPPQPPRPGVGDITAAPKVRKAGLFDPCNNSDCNIESYKTDCTVAGGGLSSEEGGAITCNKGPQHDPK
jgi:hypothetical protein